MKPLFYFTNLIEAAFWATNPNNTYIGNHVAGSTHFGYWYRLLNNPDGPSFTPGYCPINIPFGVFSNNSVHAVGRFGLWIFPTYIPTVSGGCQDRNPSVARFEYLTSYSNDLGAEFVMSNNIQFVGFKIWDQYSIGIVNKQMPSYQNPNTPYSSVFYNPSVGTLISNSIVVGDSQGNQRNSQGIAFAWDRGSMLKNVSFFNFVGGYALGATEIAGRCT